MNRTTATSEACAATRAAAAKLRDLAWINPRFDLADFSASQPASFVRMAAVSELSGDIDLSDTRPISAVAKGYTRFQNGDLLFAKITPCMENGKIAIARGLVGGIGFGSTEFHVLRAKNGVLPQYLFYYVTQSAFRNEAKHNMKGTAGQKRVPADYLADCAIPLFSTAEQERVVAKVDELFSELDAGVVALERAQTLLAQYRRSILTAAVTGELTREWRQEHRADIESTCSNDDHEPEGIRLPPTWKWVTTDELSVDVRYGTSAKCTADANGIPVLRMGNLVDGELDLSSLKYLPPEHPEFPDLLLVPGDLLFNRTNSAELVGKTAVYEGDPESCSFASYLIRVRLKGYEPRLASAFINSTFGRAWIRSVVSQQVGQANVNGTKLRRLKVPVPPQDEQVQITASLEKFRAMAAQMINELVVLADRCSEMRQSILAAAFVGKLVPQDPKDEPAAKLLERLRAEREAIPVKRNGARSTQLRKSAR